VTQLPEELCWQCDASEKLAAKTGSYFLPGKSKILLALA